MKIYHLTYKNRIIPCYITFKKVKNINLRVNSKQEVRISAPRSVNYLKVLDFIESKKEWIFKKVVAFGKMVNINPPLLEDGTTVFYLGDAYQIKIKIGKNYVKREAQLMYIHVPNKEQEAIRKVYEQWQRAESQKILNNFVNELYPLIKNYGIDYPNVKIKKMYTRWGSCSYSKGNINLNQFLMTLPENVIKYVVLHELAHFIQPNHSKDFYSLIEEYMPNYCVYRDYLKKIKLR
jgi:hypothetical protein